MSIIGLYSARFFKSTFQASTELGVKTSTQQEIDILVKDIKINFQRRVPEPLTSPTPTPTPVNLTPSPSTTPFETTNETNSSACQNLTITENTSTTGVLKTVTYETVCETSQPELPTDWKRGTNLEGLFHRRLLTTCDQHAPQIKITTTIGTGTPTISYFPSPSGLAAAICFRRTYTGEVGTGPETTKQYQYNVEIVFGYRKEGTKWDVVRRTLFLTTADISPGIEILPQN